MAQSYICPYTTKEHNRLDRQHEIFSRLFDGKLHLCPCEDAKSGIILDVGTGSGSWAKNFTATFPQSSIVGFDVTPLLPTSIPRCSFRKADFHEPWRCVADIQYDLVHTRLLFASIKDIKTFVKEAYDCLKPGGYIELQEIEFPFLHAEHPGAECVDRWCTLMQEAAARRGLDLQLPRRCADALGQAGFRDIVVKKDYSMPIGEWSSTEKDLAIGAANRENILAGLDGFGRNLLLSGEHKMSETDYQILLEEMRKAVKNNDLRLCQQVFVIWARKPDSIAKAANAGL